MNDEQIDSVFESAPDLPPALANKIRAQIQRDTHLAKPMLSSSVYTLIFALGFAAVSILFAAAVQFKGLHILSTAAATQLLLALVIVALFGANTVARSMRPAGGRLRTWIIAGLAFVLYEALVIRLFSGYATDGFVHNGLLCLSFGLLCGATVATPIWIAVHRRGFVVEPVLSGAAIGLVGGLAGLTMLTLHCPILTVPHTGIWHAAVIVVCVATGAIAGRMK